MFEPIYDLFFCCFNPRKDQKRPNAHSNLEQFYIFPFSDSKMTAILDQKHYIEELNRHLSGTVTDLQAKMDSIEKTNSKLVIEVWTVLEGIPIQCQQSICVRKVGLTTKRVFSCPQLTAATDRINSLREEQEHLRKENETIVQSSQKKEEVRIHQSLTKPHLT